MKPGEECGITVLCCLVIGIICVIGIACSGNYPSLVGLWEGDQIAGDALHDALEVARDVPELHGAVNYMDGELGTEIDSLNNYWDELNDGDDITFEEADGLRTRTTDVQDAADDILNRYSPKVNRYGYYIPGTGNLSYSQMEALVAVKETAGSYATAVDTHKGTLEAVTSAANSNREAMVLRSYGIPNVPSDIQPHEVGKLLTQHGYNVTATPKADGTFDVNKAVPNDRRRLMGTLGGFPLMLLIAATMAFFLLRLLNTHKRLPKFESESLNHLDTDYQQMSRIL